jgi:hypothetical protein
MWFFPLALGAAVLSARVNAVTWRIFSTQCAPSVLWKLRLFKILMGVSLPCQIVQSSIPTGMCSKC